MHDHSWPKIVKGEVLKHRKKIWMKQNKKWLDKWNITLHECPNTNVDIKKFVLGKFQSAMWTNNSGRKKTYNIKEPNPTREHVKKA